MKLHPYIGKEPNFQFIVIASAVLHLIFITLVAVPLKTKEREYKSYYVNLVGPPAVQKGSEAPSKKEAATRNEAGAIKIKPPIARPTRKSKADMSLEPSERVAKEIERLRAISDLSKLKKRKTDKAGRAKEADEEVEQAIEVIRKRVGGDVRSGRGVPGTLTSDEVNPYLALVQEKIWGEWIYPDLGIEGLEAVVSFQIDRKGTIISPKIVKSSGSTLFDSSAIKAIMKASPLPPPPFEDEFEVRFHL